MAAEVLLALQYLHLQGFIYRLGACACHPPAALADGAGSRLRVLLGPHAHARGPGLSLPRRRS